MNSILGFIWGLVSTMLEHHIYTFNSSWLLHSEIFSVEPCPKSPQSSGWLWTHQHIHDWFSTVILPQGLKIILSVIYYGHDMNVWPKQPHLLWEIWLFFLHQFWIVWPPQNWQILVYFKRKHEKHIHVKGVQSHPDLRYLTLFSYSMTL